MFKTVDVSKIKLLSDFFLNRSVIVKGWVKSNRVSKKIGFLVFVDGLSNVTIQIVYKLDELVNFFAISKLLPGSAIIVKGQVVTAQNQEEIVEIIGKNITIVNPTSADYFLQKKKHSKEFLRTKSELRARSSCFYAVFKIRSTLSLAIHHFFQKENFFHLHPPIITNNDCEGGGENFLITDQDKKESHFFPQPASLSVSGQLHAEAFAQIYQKVYTFAPAFRADKSNTRFHGAEFWMVEPELAFANLEDVIDLTTRMIKFISQEVYVKNHQELTYLSKFHTLDLKTRLEKLVKKAFITVDYQQMIDKLQLKWGTDFTKEEELKISQLYDNQPVFITNYPEKIKAFYMKKNPDQKTVACFDLIFPITGEVAGGSQREDDYQILVKNLKKRGLVMKDLAWYLNLRLQGYGGSSGFGFGFDRFLIYITGMSNIRDVIPFYVGFKNLNY